MSLNQTDVSTRSPINGSTALYGVIGTPVAPLKSPEVWSKKFADLGINSIFLPFDASPARVDTVAAGLIALENFKGLIVTMPHKQAASKWPDELTHEAKRAGAVSMLRPIGDGRWEGGLCEEEAVVLALSAVGYSPAGKTALVIGAGGAGTSIAWALADARVSRLAIVDSDSARAEALVGRIKAETGLDVQHVNNNPAGYDLVVNATPVGMNDGDPLPTSIEALDPGTTVLDMIVEPRPTRFLKQAADKGLVTVDGMAVLSQTVAVIGKYFGLGDRW
jgi:shikimate dehydrogenase